MEKNTAFNYSYSARANKEIEEIRKKYLPQYESKFDELRRLDRCVQNSGITEALCAGIGGTLLLGLGVCLITKVIGGGIFFTVLGALLGIVGMTEMLAAYPLYRSVLEKTKARLTPRILELAAELSGERVSRVNKTKN